MVKQRRACDACYKRKIQCDLSGPGTKCNWCQHRGSPCTFSRVRGRNKNKGPKSNAFRKDMAERIERLEDAIASAGALGEKEQAPSTSATNLVSTSPDAAQPASGPAVRHTTPASNFQTPRGTVTPPSSTSCVTLGKVYFGGHYLGAINSQDSMPSISAEGQRWIFSATGEWPSLPSLDSNDALDRHHRFACSAAAQGSYRYPGQTTTIPDIGVVKSLLNLFLSSDICRVFPLIDPVLIQDTLALAYGPYKESRLPEITAAKAVVFAFVSFTGFHFPTATEGSSIDTDACAAASQSLSSNTIEDASLMTLQTTIFLLLYHTASGRLRASSICHGVACQVVFVLGGHTLSIPPPHDRDLTTRERQDNQLRNMFWLVYTFDKEIALRTGQPPIMSDEFCDLSLPYGYLDQRCIGAAAERKDMREAVPLLPGDIRLSILKSKTCRLLYSIEASRKTDIELLRSIRELDEELENWRVSIPQEFAPALSTRAKNADWGLHEHEPGRNMQRIMLNLEYQHLMTAIHSASGRCMKPPGDANERVLGIQSSLELSVEASRATLTYVRAATHKFPADAFWFLIFYPMSALMNLFFHTLRFPLDDQTTHDIERLNSVGALIKSYCDRHRLKHYDAVRVENLNRFITELSRLGNCAIAKAQAEKQR